ncbi:unnamed protein product [Diamesa tonsa]
MISTKSVKFKDVEHTVDLSSERLYKNKRNKDETIEMLEECYSPEQNEIIDNNHDADNIDSEIFECFFCSESFHKKSSVDRHLDKHRRLCCNVCQKIYKARDKFKDHLKTHFLAYQCDECGKIFNKKIKFDCHAEKYHGIESTQSARMKNSAKRMYKCDFCPRVFEINLARHAHQRTIHKNNRIDPFKCKDCGLSFIMREELRMHAFSHYSGKIHTCTEENCGKIFKTGKQLGSHVKIHSAPRYQCNVCFQTFVQCSGLKKHSKRCKGKHEPVPELSLEEKERIANIAQKQFRLFGGRCAVVKKSRIRKSLKKSDEVLEENDDWKMWNDGVVPVKLDGFQTENLHEIMLDNIIESEPTNKPTLEPPSKFYSCDNCSYKTLRKTKLSNHVRGHRQCKINIKSLVACFDCDTNFKNVSKYREHMKTVHKVLANVGIIAVNESKIICELCGKFSNNKKSAHEHSKRHYTKHVQCDVCLKQLLPKTIRAHMKRHHNTEQVEHNDIIEEIPCHACGKQFKNQSYVDLHFQRMHVEENRDRGVTYRCRECGEAFYRKLELTQHGLAVHFNGKIYSCSICNMHFKKPYLLGSHQIIHHSERTPPSIECIVCKKFYSQESSLRKHLIKVHTVSNQLKPPRGMNKLKF